MPADLSRFPKWAALVKRSSKHRKLWLEGKFPPPSVLHRMTKAPDRPQAKPRHMDGAKPVVRGGVGTELSALLARWGIKEKAGCKCKSRAALMDARGIAWCENHIETIVGWLQEEAVKRRLPFVKTLGRLLIRKAIRSAMKKAAQ